jgi:hypothetical protein
MARIPAVVVSADEAATPGVLRLNVSGGSAQTPLRIELTDQGGEARLYRNLTLAERARGGDCQALADTVALIVERFLHDLGYEAPPSPPPPLQEMPRDNLARGPPPALAAANRFDVFAGGAWRGASTADSDFEVGLGLGFERGLGNRRVAATFTGGLSSARVAQYQDNNNGEGSIRNINATLRRVPVRFGLFLPLILGPGWLEPGLRLAIDWLFISRNWEGGNDNRMFPSPGAELVLAFRIGLVNRLFARIGVSGGTGIPYDVRLPAPSTQHLFSQPRFYARSGLELGFSFQ